MRRQLDDNHNEDGALRVSQSKVRQYRTCRRQFFYAHVMKIQRKRVPRPLAFGSIAHKMKESMALGGDPFQVLDELPREDLDVYESEPERYGDLVQDLDYIFRSYIEFYKNELLEYIPHGNHVAEIPFELPLPKEELVIKGTIDAVTRHRRMNWLTEHKNHKNIPNDDERWRSVQSVVYIKVIGMLGWWKNIEGTCWDYIRTKPPTHPQILKDGTISKRKIDTLPNVVRDVLKKKFGRTDAYKTLVDMATANMSTYFQRVYTPIKTRLIDQVWSDFLSTAREMRDSNLTDPPVRTIGRHCSWCQFEPLCRASLTGGDEEYLIEREYIPSTYGDKDVEETSST